MPTLYITHGDHEDRYDDLDQAAYDRILDSGDVVGTHTTGLVAHPIVAL